MNQGIHTHNRSVDCAYNGRDKEGDEVFVIARTNTVTNLQNTTQGESLALSY